jgi:hypothetical protein
VEGYGRQKKKVTDGGERCKKPRIYLGNLDHLGDLDINQFGGDGRSVAQDWSVVAFKVDRGIQGRIFLEVRPPFQLLLRTLL